TVSHHTLYSINTCTLQMFFLSPSPPPPTSTLFPYTTLFRSELEQSAPRGLGRRALTFAVPVGDDFLEVVRRGHGQDASRRADLLDRKSTRLNSSHVAISYAVFCLKKKK